jgi:branched-chain amino acid transport system ATP-binding protein
MLTISELRVSYGGVPALQGIDLELTAGEHLALVGPNGAGKTTLLKAVSGIVPVEAGTIHFDGQDLSAIPGHERARMGIVHVPEGRHVFKSMTVRENLMLGAYRAAARSRFDEAMALVAELFPPLTEMLGRDGGSLSGGQQQMLAIARGLCSWPRLLLLDEPSMGLAPAAAELIFEGIGRLHEMEDMALVLVEQRAHEALELSERAYVLESGEVVAAGPTTDLLAEGDLVRAYLGGEL